MYCTHTPNFSKIRQPAPDLLQFDKFSWPVFQGKEEANLYPHSLRCEWSSLDHMGGRLHIGRSSALHEFVSDFSRIATSKRSDRQHLSNVCLEVRRKIVRTVLCCIVYWSCAQS